MKKALILSYYWPPGSGPGVQRWLKFCKYLPEFDWEPIVITVKNGSYPSKDESLLNDVPDDLKVYRTNSIEPFVLYNMLRGKKGKSVEVAMASVKGKQSRFARFANYIRSNYFIPDARVGWNAYSYPQALKLIKKYNPDVIVTTGPPHSTHLVGERIHKQTGLPWVADFRDPWTTIYYNQFLLRTEKSTQKDAQLETSVVSTASSMLVATPGMMEEFKDRARNISFIPNGFDEDDFENLQPEANTSFTLAYVGNLKPVQNVKTLWQAIRELIDENESFKQHFKLAITGNVAQEVLEEIKRNELDEWVSIRPFVPHKESISRMLAAHALLLPIPEDPNNKVILTGKLFEYLATQRPILSIGPTDGNASDILNACNKEAMIAYDDKETMKSVLLSLLAQYQQDANPVTTGNDHYKTYSRKGTTSSLAKLFEELC